MKKTLALILALVMVFALAIPAMAADAAKGTVTVTNATVGETYQAFKVFDATYNETTKAISYTIEKTSPWYSAVVDSGLFTLTEKSGTVYVTSTATAKQISEWANEAILADAVKNTAVATEVAGSTTVTFGGLAYGYYFISSSLGSVVTIDSNTPSVKIIDKNSRIVPNIPGIDGGIKAIKEGDVFLTHSTSAFGEDIDYYISVKAPNYIGDKKVDHYNVYDGFDFGITIDPDSVELYIGGEKVDLPADYNFVQSVPAEAESGEITMTIPWLDENGDFLYDNNAEITITCTGVLNEYASQFNSSIGNGDGNCNYVEIDAFTVDNDGDTPDDKIEDIVYTNTFALTIFKTDEEGTALEGAQFTIKDADGNDIYVAPYVDAKGKDSTIKFKVVKDASEGSNIITTPKRGNVSICGLDEGTYSIVEVNAPDGYNKLPDAVPVTLDLNQETAVIHELKFGSDAQSIVVSAMSVMVNVINTTGVELPSTGGIGTTIFYIVGGLLVVGAAVVLVSKKRMSAEG